MYFYKFVWILIFILDKGLTEEKSILGNNTEKQLLNMNEIENEAALLFKHVSNSYSEALDSIKSEL